MPGTAPMVNTGKVQGRRTLAFKSLDEALADAQRLVASKDSEKLTHLGNWSLGQALGHLAYWINLPFDGYPQELSPPWFIKLVVKMMKQKYLSGQMPAGVRIPRFKEGTLGTADMPPREGLDRYRKAVERLKAAAPSCDNPLFGPMTHDEWIRLNLSHASLHLSFFVP
jgi:hypothetical protein